MKKQILTKRRKITKKNLIGILILLSAIIFGNAHLYADGNEQLGITLPVFTGKYDVGVVSLGSFGLRGEATTLMKIPEDAEIIAAYVYLSAYSNLAASQLGDIPITFSNDDSVIVNVTATVVGLSEESQNQCFTYRADVSEVVTTGENRYKVQAYTLPVRPTGGRLYGGGLIVIYGLPNLPEANIWIADGLDYFDAQNGYPASNTAIFPFDGNRFERYASVKMFAGVDLTTSASAVWSKIGSGSLPTGDIIDTEGAIDYNNSSSSDAAVDTDPLTEGLGIRRRWSMVEYELPVYSEQGWAAFQLESQTDFDDKAPFSGVWNMVAFRLPLEETGISSIGDRVFHDKNSDGTRDSMEPGAPGVLVSLYLDNEDNQFDPATDTLVDSVRTNRLGFYLFRYLEAGTYFVDIDHPYMSKSEFVLTTNNDPTPPIVLEKGVSLLDIDFGFRVEGHEQFGPTVYYDFDAMGDSNWVIVSWSTDPGTENMGYDVCRCGEEYGEYQVINASVIPASNGTGDVHYYSFEDNTVESGETYYYKIADIDLAGNSNMSDPVEITATTTDIQTDGKDSQLINYELKNAYPNPFNGTTTIKYTMKISENVTIEMYNLLGQKIRTLVSQVKEAGNHHVSWNGNDDFNQAVGSGIYFYKMTTENYRATKRILYLK